MKSSLAAVLLILQGAVNLMISAVFISIPGMIQSLAEDAPPFLFSLFTVFSAVFVIIGILQVIAGIGVLSAASWSWGFGIGVSILGLFRFPIGTIMAIICLVVLMSSKEEFGAEKGARATGERESDEEWPLILGTIVLVAGILWMLATYVETPYAWALAFGIIGMTLIILDRALRTQTKGLEILGEISLGAGVFLALFVSGISTEYVAVPIIVSGLLIILAYYISKRNRDAGRVIAVLCIAVVLGAACSPLYHADRLVRVGWDGDWADGIGKGYNVSETRYFEPKDRISVENVNGRIYVEGWSENRIKLEYTKHASRGASLSDLRVGIRESAEELDIITEMPGWPVTGNLWIDYMLLVPEDSVNEFIIESTNGEISVNNLSETSKIDAETVNGEIEMNWVYAGSADIHTTNAEIAIVGSSFRDLYAQTTNGEIDTALAQVGNVSLKTTNGEISLWIPEYHNVAIEAKTSSGEIEFEPGSAMVVKKASERELIASMEPVRYRIKLQTINGDIEIKGE